MKQHLLTAAILLIAHSSQLIAPPVYAGSTDECRELTNREAAKELRLYRAYLFGKPKAEDAPIGDVRYDEDGWAWKKVSNTALAWIHSHPDFQGSISPNTNGVMDIMDEHADDIPIKGIFETARVSTSELIPYLLQSIRALECRLDALCEVTRFSEPYFDDDPVEIGDVQPIGCIEFPDQKTFPECHFGGFDESVGDQSDNRPYCDEITEQLLRREIALLKLAVEYDAGYRSLLQFAGNFDIFLREMRWPLTGTIRYAVSLIGQLGRIPCFLSSCDSAPIDIE